MDLMEQVKVRAMKKKDLKAVGAIEEAILGHSRTAYWENKIAAIKKLSGIAPLVAELDGKVVGFIIGEASGWEYGVPEEIGWVHTIGIDPDYQGKGIGAVLLREMLDNLKKVGVTTVYTLINWKDGALLRFFDRMDFDLGDMLNLQKRL